MSDSETLRSAIDAARAHPRLGRSALVRDLFEYLAKNSLDGRSPKETEVAIEIFGRQPDFDPTRDAVARVYVHKLRRRLEEIADGAGQGLTIPRGEYRLALRDAQTAAPTISTGPTRRLALAALTGLLVMLGLAGWWVMTRPTAATPSRGADSSLWTAVTSNGRPTILAIGDYYIFGDLAPDGGAGRLVREYTVNSPEDLSQYVRDNPKRGTGYADLGLRYVPVGSASTLMNVTLALQGAKDLRVLPVSSLTPAMLRDNNIVYIGYLSGLGILRDPTFAGSRYAIGETYDEIIDKPTGKHFVSGGGMPHAADVLYADFGYLATFAGPSGNRFVIVAGTRDAALMQMGQSATNRGALDDLMRAGGKGASAEALYGINGMGEVNVDSRLIRSSPLDQKRIWDQDSTQAQSFPTG